MVKTPQFKKNNLQQQELTPSNSSHSNFLAPSGLTPTTQSKKF